MLTREILQRVQSDYSKGVQSDDTRLSNRHIYSKLLSVRALLLTQKSNKKQKIGQSNYQTIPCVKMIQVPIVECPCILTRGQYILRTEHKFPRILTGISSHLLQSVMGADGFSKYSETTWDSMKYASGSKYTGKEPKFFFKNDYLYITASKYPEIIVPTGLFENPLEVENYPNGCCGDDVIDCTSPLDKEFPLDSSLIEVAIQMTTEELLRIFLSVRQDNSNNSRDRNEEQQRTES